MAGIGSWSTVGVPSGWRRGGAHDCVSPPYILPSRQSGLRYASIAASNKTCTYCTACKWCGNSQYNQRVQIVCVLGRRKYTSKYNDKIYKDHPPEDNTMNLLEKIVTVY